MSAKYAIIGDVHSQITPLNMALDYCRSEGLTPIFLGDLFDSQCDISDSVGVYFAIREAEDSLNAVILQSNHQFLLQKLARREPVSLKKDIARTVRDFSNAGICIREVANWLETFPYAIAFKDSRGLEYRAAHAEFPASVEVPLEYVGMWKFYNPSPPELRLLLWGKEYTLPDRIRFWWLQPAQRSWISVAGHYHKVVKRNMSLVLDAGCGGKSRSWYDKRPPELLLYEVETKKIVSFPA